MDFVFYSIFFNYLFKTEYVPNYAVADRASSEVAKVISDESKSDSVRITVDGLRDAIYLKSGTGEVLVTKAKAELQKLTDDYSSYLWWHRFYDYLTFALSFPIISYLLARAVHWIWLGFKRPAE